MRTIPAGLVTHYQGETTSVVRLWKVTRRDALVFRFTNADIDIVIAGDGVYTAATGFEASTLKSTGQLDVDNNEISGYLASGAITEPDLAAGLWDGATVQVSECNALDPTQGVAVVSVGTIGQVRNTEIGFVAETLGLTQRLGSVVVRMILPSCDADFGDARCTVALGPLTITAVPVTTVTSQSRVIASSLAQAAGYFDYGKVTFTTGANTGMQREIKAHIAGGDLTFEEALPFTIAVADQFSIHPGCAKRKIEDCKTRWNNLVNFRGFAELPGLDALIKGAT